MKVVTHIKNVIAFLICSMAMNAGITNAAQNNIGSFTKQLRTMNALAMTNAKMLSCHRDASALMITLMSPSKETCNDIIHDLVYMVAQETVAFEKEFKRTMSNKELVNIKADTMLSLAYDITTQWLTWSKEEFEKYVKRVTNKFRNE
ncbi:MAG: hypothetical protein V3U78_00900 [Thiotrichaceae bacterium]